MLLWKKIRLMNNPGIVICTRSNSKRIINKPLQQVGNPPETLIKILAERLEGIGIPFVFALPMNEFLKDLDIELSKYKTYFGSNDNVLCRFYKAAFDYSFDPIIRITHDDILIDEDVLKSQLEYHIKNNLDYSYPVNVIEGTGAEIVSMWGVAKAAKYYEKYKELEHLSYVFKKFSKNISPFDAFEEGIRPLIGDFRLTIDYPEDLTLFKILYEYFKGDINLINIYNHSKQFETLAKINKKPDITVYTCVRNGAKTLQRVIKSVLDQKGVNIEYIICEDGSTDNTREILWEYIGRSDIKIIWNKENKGLAYSSNRCLEEAKGDYFIRIDADDEFVEDCALGQIYHWLKHDSAEAGICYTSYYKNYSQIDSTTHRPDINHHIGCAMINRKVFEEIKFNENLKHWDGLDFYNRLMKYEMYKILYVHVPLWIYHQSSDSLSKSEPKKRTDIKKAIRLGLTDS